MYLVTCYLLPVTCYLLALAAGLIEYFDHLWFGNAIYLEFTEMAYLLTDQVELFAFQNMGIKTTTGQYHGNKT